MPDYFVAEDTTALTPYYSEVVTKGVISQFCFDYVDRNREKLQEYTKAADLEKYLRRQGVVDQFIRYADSKGIKRRNNMIIKSHHLLDEAIYGSIIYNMLNMNDYTEYINADDPTIKKAIEMFDAHKTKPTIDEQTGTAEDNLRKKKTAFHRGTSLDESKNHQHIA